MTARLWLGLAAAYGFLAVALGAFGAHELKTRLEVDQLATYRTGVEYLFWHALALLAVGLLAGQRALPGLHYAGLGFALGILLFSGSLFALSLTGIRAFGPITPIGGLLLLAGWASLLVAVLRGDAAWG